jgi:hypothetical protein
MIACPNCQAENSPSAGSCAQCDAKLAADEYEEFPTQRTRPRLLVLRPAPKPADPAGATDHDIGLIADPPPTPSLPTLRLKVVRGLRMSAEYPLYDGANLIGRSDERPVDIDLRDQEPRDTVWASRNHAIVTLASGVLTVEDLNSTNGTYVNRHRLPPGSKRTIKADDVLQIGTIQLKVTR